MDGISVPRFDTRHFGKQRWIRENVMNSCNEERSLGGVRLGYISVTLQLGDLILTSTQPTDMVKAGCDQEVGECEIARRLVMRERHSVSKCTGRELCSLQMPSLA